MFVPFTVQNSISLPAVFVLRLNEPMPICLQLAENIKSVIEMDLEMSSPRSLLRMIIEPSSQPLSVVSCTKHKIIYYTMITVLIYLLPFFFKLHLNFYSF